MSHVSCLRSCWTVYCTQKNAASPPNHSGLRIWDDPRILWKSINFRASLQGNKSHGNWSQGYPKSWKIDPGIIRNPIFTEVDFCNTSNAKCMFFNPRHRNLDPTTNRKNNLELDMKKSSFFVQKCPNNFQNGSPKSSKNRQNPSLDPTGSFLVPSNVPGSSQDRPRVPHPRTPK